MEPRLPECWARDLGDFKPFGALWLGGDAATKKQATELATAARGRDAGGSDAQASEGGRFWLFSSHQDDYAAEEELYVSGKRLVWSCGQRVVKALTLPADVIQALWCPFPEDRGGGAAEDSERRAAAKWLCALTSRELHAVSPSGEMHVVALPFRAEKMWEAGGRILLHAEPGARKQGPALRCGAPPCRAGSARPRPHLRAVPRPSLAPPRVTRRAPPGDCRCSSPWITPLTPRARSAAWRRGRRTKSRSRGCWFAFPTRPPSRERSSKAVIIGDALVRRVRLVRGGGRGVST